MFSMNIHVFAGRKCSKTTKNQHSIPASVQVKKTNDGFLSLNVKAFCISSNPVVMDQDMSVKIIAGSAGQKNSVYKFFQPNHYSNPPFAPPRSVLH